MSRWFRHYAGMMRDEKLVRVAVKARQPVERVVWIWGAILESAAEINNAGRYELDTGEAAYFLRCDESDLVDVIAGLVSLGRLADGVVAKWSDRQFDSDSAKERQRRYRERKQTGNPVQRRDGDVAAESRDVTRPSRDGEVTLQESETETDSYAAKARDPLQGREGEMLAALRITDETKLPGLLILSEPYHWVTNGCDIDLDILPTLRAIGAKGKRLSGWAYCSKAVFEARDRRLAPAPAVQQRQATGPPSPASEPTTGNIWTREASDLGYFDEFASPKTQRNAHGDRTGNRGRAFPTIDVAVQKN